jgi:hypothetical protein
VSRCPFDLILLRREGMAVWMKRAALRITAELSQVRQRCSSLATTTQYDSLQANLVGVLANMAMAIGKENTT